MSALVQSRLSDQEPLLARTADDACTSSWDDARLVAEITAAERQARAAAARVVRLTAEFARRHPEPSPGATDDGLPLAALDELSVACGLARGAFAYRLRDAQLLSRRFPKLLDAWEAGLLNVTAVRKVLDVAHGVPESLCARLESDLLRRLGRPTHADLATMTLPQLQAIDDDTAMSVSSRATTATVGRITRDLVARLAPEARAERVALARARRRVTLDDGADGMSWLSASLTQAAAWASFEHVDALARALPEHPDDERTLDAKRADVYVDLLLGAGPDGAGIPPEHPVGDRAHEQVTGELTNAPGIVERQFPAVSLDAGDSIGSTGSTGSTDPTGATGANASTGATDRGDPQRQTYPPPPRVPAAINLQVLLDHSRCRPQSGCFAEAGRLGSVTAETVAELIAMTLERGGAITGGHVTEQPCPGPAAHRRLGPGSYQPGEALKRYVRARNRSCVWPGCDRVARACELDHTVPYPAGPTCACNLAPLCVYHHHVKHRPGVDGRPGWRLVNHGGGHLTWVTPTGRAVEVWPEQDVGSESEGWAAEHPQGSEALTGFAQGP